MPGLLGEKLGMTQIFNEKGQRVPVTVIKAGPCVVVQKKLGLKEGYSAIQVGFQEADLKKALKPLAGHFVKKQLKGYKVLREFRTTQADSYQPGEELTVSLFRMGDLIDVCGTSKGKGFQGVMKRHHFAGGYASHGCSISHRSAGSVGQRTYPGKIFKGKRMAGRMGGDQVTVQNLMVVGIEPEQHLLLIKGAVPGANHSVLMIYPKAGDFEKRREGKKETPTAS